MATLLTFPQLSKTWKVAAGTAIALLSAGGIVVLLHGQNSAGKDTWKDLSDGSREQSGSLLIHSGSNLILLQNNGDAIIGGTLTGNHLYAGTFSGAGLISCSNSTTSKLLWNSATKTFSCGTDQSGGGNNWSNTGSLQSYFDPRYVNTAGDTMTGALTTTTGATFGYRVIINAVGSGASVGTQTGAVRGALNIVNTYGQSILKVFENGLLYAGFPRSFTGATEVGQHPVMGRRTGYAAPVSINATSVTAVGLNAVTSSGTVASPAGNAGQRMYLKHTALNGTDAGAGLYATSMIDTEQQFQPRVTLAMRTGTGTANMRFFFGLTNKRSIAGASDPFTTVVGTFMNVTTHYVGIGWEDGVNGTKWMCCSGDGILAHSCKDMGLPVQLNTDYLLDVDWSNPNALSCTISNGVASAHVIKETDLSTNYSLALGWIAILRQKSIGSNARSWYFGKFAIDQN